MCGQFPSVTYSDLISQCASVHTFLIQKRGMTENIEYEQYQSQCL